MTHEGHKSLQEESLSLPDTFIDRVLDNAGLLGQASREDIPDKSWGFSTHLPPIDDNQGQYLAQLQSSSTFASPDSIPAMLKAYGLPSDIFQGSVISRDHGPEKDAALEQSRAQLKQSINRAWSQEAVERGINHAREKNFARALECYKQALDKCPDNIDALVAAGAARANQEDFEAALQCFDHAIALCPDHENALKYRSAVTERLIKQSSEGEPLGNKEASSSERGNSEGTSSHSREDTPNRFQAAEKASDSRQMDTQEALRVVSQHYERHGSRHRKSERKKEKQKRKKRKKERRPGHKESKGKTE